MINCPHFNPKKKNGFTMIEIIIVFSVIAVLSAVGIAASVSYSRAQALEAATQDLKTVLNQAKSYAQSQYKPVDCGGQILTNYRIAIDNINNEYVLSAYCGGVYPIVNAKLPDNISFDPTVSPPDYNPSSYFDFPILTGGIQAEGSSPWGIKILGQDDRYKVITIEANGSIK